MQLTLNTEDILIGTVWVSYTIISHIIPLINTDIVSEKENLTFKLAKLLNLDGKDWENLTEVVFGKVYQ